ncbi:MAG: phosphotransferase, partial [Deltaproteobacteria bacterium]|nr:phosphotransferase [Deltaproteobacteria bacterium]
MTDFEKTESSPPSHAALPYAPRNRWKPDRQGDAIVKDYGRRSLLVRAFGRLCLRWEEAALRRLEGIEGIPAFLGRPTPDSLKMGAVPGEPLAKRKRGELSEAFLRNLATLFDLMHQRGVAHGDAHKRNILADGERPYLVDFSTAYVRGRLPLLDEYVFRCFVSLDLERLYKVEK